MSRVPPRPAHPLLVLSGNPNVGKTTLFNALTGLSAKVSNYPGITVEVRSGTVPLSGGRLADLHDVPGTYSLNARSAEERIAFDAITGLANIDGTAGRVPDVVILCIDASQVARSAYLLMQCQELGARCVVALTMVDEAKAASPDAKALGAVLGCEVVPVTARTRVGLPQLVAAIERTLTTTRSAPWRWEPTAAVRAHIAAARAALPEAWTSTARYGAPLSAADDALALWAVTSVEPRTGGHDDDELELPAGLRAAATGPADADADADHDAPILARWAWLDRTIPALVTGKPDHSRTERIDRILLHRAAGFVIFLAVMGVVFMTLFAWSGPLIDGVDSAFKALGGVVQDVIGDGILTDFVVDGLIAGVGSVLVFLPQILLLFLFLGFLEDCGYLARVAYLMDRIMRLMNLHGRAFVPMLSGFACAIPAVMATRTMERRRDRILTMMVVPLMTCSARLPVYTLIIGTLIAGSPLVGGLLMVGMYLFSVLTALIAAWVMSKTVKQLRAKRLPFLIELPPYRWPRGIDVLRMMWTRSSMFLREAGTVILACSIALWALLAFPRELPAGSPDYDALIARAPTAEVKADLAHHKSGALLENSYGGRLGHAIEPVLAPLGFDWKIGIGIIGAFAAREVFVSTLGIVYSVGDDADEASEPLRAALRNEKRADGSRAYTPLVGMSLMVFFALACQCMSTVAVVKRESGGWGWPLFMFGYMTGLAWVTSFLVYQGGRLLGFS